MPRRKSWLTMGELAVTGSFVLVKIEGGPSAHQIVYTVDWEVHGYLFEIEVILEIDGSFDVELTRIQDRLTSECWYNGDELPNGLVTCQSYFHTCLAQEEFANEVLQISSIWGQYDD